MADELGLGVMGCGSFGLFALQQFVQVPGVRLVAMADIERRLPAVAATQRYGLADIIDVDRLLELPDVDVVYISTPPFLHYTQSKSALAAGKHVVCEKPLALTVEQADELVGLARRRKLDEAEQHSEVLDVGEGAFDDADDELFDPTEFIDDDDEF